MSRSDGELAWHGKTYNALRDKKHLTGINKEVLNEISFSRFLEQVDSKVWRVHQSRSCKLILDLMITEGNKQKRAGPFLALPLSSLHAPFHKAGVDCLLNFLKYLSAD